MNEQFVFVKLITGEQLMAIKDSDDGTSITLRYPMLIKNYVVSNTGDRVSEQVTAGPYSLFIADKVFTIDKRHVVLDVHLAQAAIVHYTQLVKNHEGISIEYDKDGLIWEDEIEEEDDHGFKDIEDLARAIGQLKSIADEMDEEGTVLVEGNETVH